MLLYVIVSVLRVNWRAEIGRVWVERSDVACSTSNVTCDVTYDHVASLTTLTGLEQAELIITEWFTALTTDTASTVRDCTATAAVCLQLTVQLYRDGTPRCTEIIYDLFRRLRRRVVASWRNTTGSDDDDEVFSCLRDDVVRGRWGKLPNRNDKDRHTGTGFNCHRVIVKFQLLWLRLKL